MNKHAQNLRALPIILPVGTPQTILDTLARAADEIDRLDSTKEFDEQMYSLTMLNRYQDANEISKKITGKLGKHPSNGKEN